ncbi:MAG TPA: glycoside hydrolase family 3 N-terminal domain-containing protein [Longimicrobium sp.]|uniref:glycoside hydrolase family 3 protein n=1 Tax=Longimicrobium sp. TaxID=2029185 RepID=UPI002ED8D1F9
MPMIRLPSALLLLALGCAPAATPPAAPVQAPSAPADGLDAEQQAWVDSTLASLTLRQKAGQVVFGWTGGEYVAADSPEMERLLEMVERDGIGGLVISMGLPHSYAAKLNALQRRAPVPLLVTTDMENGPGMRLAGGYALPSLLPLGGGTSFPPVMALGAVGSDSLAYQVGRVIGREARAVGVHLTFGPVLDVNSNPLNPIINVRSFGENAGEVARLGSALSRGIRSAGLLSAGKHFPGHGDAEADTHIGFAAIRADRARLDSVELVPFRAAVRAGIDGMMVAHISMTGIEGPEAAPASLSPAITRDLLRRDLGFGGLVFTDAMNMGAVIRRYGQREPLLLALEAGADVLLQPIDPREAVDAVVAAVQAGRVAPERLDGSVRRVLAAKARAGLHRRRTTELDSVESVVGSRAHGELAQRVAERSITLVRDETGQVPLAPGRRVLSITYAQPADIMAGRGFDRELAAGGWTVASARVDDRTPPDEYARLRALADSADVVVASAYVMPREYSGTVGARGGFPALVQSLAAAGRPVVAVSFGSPYVVEAFPAVPAYLLAWGGAEVSQRAAARALAGEAAIGGRLPVSLPPRHPLGTGLARPARTPPGRP